ncbi:MAG: inositol-1-monophosphatase [Wenzhouxiangellaceae bacterium]
MINSGPLQIAVQAARKAGDIIRRSIAQSEGTRIQEKGRFDYVSEIDQHCEQVIIDTIRHAFPHDHIIAEEGGSNTSDRVDDTHTWVIDPLDGTSNFLHQINHVAVSIALQINGRTEEAVVYDPLREELFTAKRGRGAYLNNRRLRVTPRVNLEGALLATGFPFRKRRHLDAYLAMFKDFFEQIEDMRRCGSAALDLAYVASGRYDGYWEIGLKPWDLAAGALLVREAGGGVVDFAGGEKYEHSGNIIAASFKLVPPMLKIIQQHATAGLRS